MTTRRSPFTVFARLGLALGIGVLSAASMAAKPASAAASSAKAASAARAPAAVAALPSPQGRSMEGAPFALSQLRGKVVMLMYWSTDCAVCRDKMAELRQNAQGWAGKPFQLVLVSTDRRMADVDDYERIVMRTLPGQSQFVRLWAGDPQFRDTLPRPTQLPATYLIDAKGRVVDQFIGRIPNEAWDRIADLL